ncbi:MAG: outer membrane protein transport protein [Micavibrio aeruginosavorus]|uniref:Outer membrane protein transport protein n=1 Tax=Micavibrio aeruginosavorus TaxID=349221 RepID=A0A7T5R2Y7_9BACT|nr:MAG: outer membrane protein transport protein [Micavibrio aeruginosavorus]
MSVSCTRKALLVTTISLGLICIVADAKAAGFYIQESSITGLGYAFSGASTVLDDATVVYYNPAGMTQINRPTLTMGATLLMPESELTNTGTTFGGVSFSGTGDGGNPYSATPVPTLAAVYPLIQDFLWAGISVNAPFGLANEYDAGWFGRYDSTETELTTINVSPSVAVKVDENISIGAGIDIQYADATLKADINAGAAGIGVSTLEGDDLSAGFHAGIQVRPWDGTTLAAHYRSKMNHNLQGRIKVEGLLAGNSNTLGNAQLNLPDIATFGIAQQLDPQWKVMGQAMWFGWNEFDEIRAKSNAGTTLSNVVQNYQPSWAFAIGAEYVMNDTWTFRGGIQYDQTPTTDEYRTSRTPDGDRTWFTVGTTYAVNEHWDIDLAAGYINIASEEINVTRNSGSAVVRADTKGHVGLLAAGFSYKF